MSRRKRSAAPPKTPKGMVWRTVDYGGLSVTKLVKAEEVQRIAAERMAMFDAQPRFIRKQQWGC